MLKEINPRWEDIPVSEAEIALMHELREMSYPQFLYTKYWEMVRNECLKRARNMCQRCGNTKCLQVHHKTYEHHGQEHRYLQDLAVLCDTCHEHFHHWQKTWAQLKEKFPGIVATNSDQFIQRYIGRHVIEEPVDSLNP